MKYRLLAALGLLCWPALCGAGEPRFAPPVRLKAGGVPIRVEAPGYAAPCLADVDGDGKPDLLVGQFNGGKIRVFKGLGRGNFAAGAWLQAEGKVAEVPGVW
jgi:FG-GAP-like repeat